MLLCVCQVQYSPGCVAKPRNIQISALRGPNPASVMELVMTNGVRRSDGEDRDRDRRLGPAAFKDGDVSRLADLLRAFVDQN